MEENLIKMAKLGDKDAFMDLVDLYKRRLYSIARSRLDQEADVKDAIQETLYQTYKNLDNINLDKSLSGWVVKVLINNCNDILRSRARFFCSYDNLDCDTYVITENVFIEVDSELDIFTFMDFLANEEKTILILYVLHGYTANEIGELLNINENTVRTKIRRIKVKIRDKYESEY